MRTGLILLGATIALLAESTAGLSWTAPRGWVSKGASAMRAATYTVQDAECVVYFFGQGQGGSVSANMDRWKSQFTVGAQPAPAKIAKSTVNGLAATSIDVTGNYAGMEGPVQSETRMLATIIEGPAGNIFLKFAGPAKTVTANQAAFQQLLQSFRKQ